MIDITHKWPSLRHALASARIHCGEATVERLRRGDVPKGDVLAMSRAVGLLAIKRTPDLLPFCHPIPIEKAEILFTFEPDGLRIDVDVAAIARTGVEVEAMTAAALTALNAYDMLKPIDDHVRIGEVRLVRKRGGQGDFGGRFAEAPRAAVLVTSDTVSAGRKEDRAGAAVRERLREEGVDVTAVAVVPDEPAQVAARLRTWCDDDHLDLVVTVGGTGLGPRDRTVEAVTGLLDRPLPGVAEAMRAHGMERTPWAALSRGIAGQRGETLIVTLPGSTRGATESLDALLPWLLHVLEVFDRAYRHDDPPQPA